MKNEKRLSINSFVKDVIGVKDIRKTVCLELYLDFINRIEKDENHLKRHILMFKDWFETSQSLFSLSKKYGYSEETIIKNIKKIEREFIKFLYGLNVVKRKDYTLIFKNSLLIEIIPKKKARNKNIVIDRNR